MCWKHLHVTHSPQAHWGQLPAQEVLDVQQSNLGAISLTPDGLFVLKDSIPQPGLTTGEWSQLAVLPALPTGISAAKIMMTESGIFAGIVHPGGIVRVSCSSSGCVSKSLSASWGAVHDTTCLGFGCTQPWVATETGLYRQKGSSILRVSAQRQFAVACAPDLSRVFSGNDDFVYEWSALTGAPGRREWVTRTSDGSGGVYADTVVAMVFVPDGTLFVATRSALNVRWGNGTVSRVDGLGGLPITNLTSISLGTVLTTDAHTAALAGGGKDVSYQLVVGSEQGAVSVQVGGVPGASTLQGPEMTPPSLWSNWRYYNGPRYLPTRSALANATGNAVLSVAAGSALSGSASGRCVLVGTTGGVGALSPVSWTLQQKAAAKKRQLSWRTPGRNHPARKRGSNSEAQVQTPT
jgi:hypothetical protein